MAHISPLPGGEPSTESLEWLKYCREQFQKSAADLDEKAKTYITVASSLATAYTGAIGLLKVLEKEIAPLWLAAIPVVLWVVSIVLLSRVLWPGVYTINPSSVTQIHKFTEILPAEKYNRLKLGGIFSLISVAFMLFVLLLGSWLGSLTTPAKNVQFIITQEKQASFIGIPISLEAGTNRTTIVRLQGETTDSYKIQLSDGTNIQLKKDLVGSIIFR